eukprot:m.57824 g.57824  ORF g.57824 m.57824 type:complete len:395 (+) comp6855_c0_seq1:1492-2676(+)
MASAAAPATTIERPAMAAAAPAVAVEDTCQVCLGMVSDNLQCVRCRSLFCRECILKWLDSSDLKACPTCRNPDVHGFAQNSEAEARVSALPYKCEYGCKQTKLTWGARKAHAQTCENFPVSCPYLGCTAKCTRGDVDAHTYHCRFSNQYHVDTVLARVAAAQQASAAMDTHAVYEAFLRERPAKMPSEAPAAGTTRHVVQDRDTLTGIALRYGTTKENLRKLNKLTTDTIFANTVLVVPQVDGKEVPFEEPPAPPQEVVLALHRRRLTRQVMVSTQLPAEEAIAYLRMAHYNVVNAINLHKDDAEWARTHAFKPARSLSEFLKRPQTVVKAECTMCGMLVCDKKRHCPACGSIVCFACIVREGHFMHAVPKAKLGATAPSARGEMIDVCNSCSK